MDKLKKILISLIILIYASILLFPLSSVLAAENSDNEIDIEISPNEFLFQIENMKPGDWAPRALVIRNKGQKEFSYLTTLKNDGGSEKLFNELLLEISDSKQELYNGKLADFNELAKRKLAPESEEELNFTVRFPESLGNEFQGLDTRFSFIFSAEGNNQKSDEVISAGEIGGDGDFSGGSALPKTASNIFNLILIGGIILIAGGGIFLYQKFKIIKGELKKS